MNASPALRLYAVYLVAVGIAACGGAGGGVSLPGTSRVLFSARSSGQTVSIGYAHPIAEHYAPNSLSNTIVQTVPAAGNLLIANVIDYTWGGGAIVDPPGWNLLNSAATSGSLTNKTYYRWVAPGDTGVWTFNFTKAAYSSVLIMELSNVSSTGSITAHQINSVAARSTFVTPALATAGVGSFAVALFSTNGSPTIASEASGWSDDFHRTGPLQDVLLHSTAAGTLQSSLTWDRSESGFATLIVLSPSANNATPAPATTGNPITIPFWQSSFTYGGRVYPFKMVGANPISSPTSTTVANEIIPLQLVFSDGTMLDASPVAAVISKSPLYTNSTYAAGTTQYGDAIMRSEFWSYAANQDYHVLLAAPLMEQPVRLDVPAADGYTKTQPDGSKMGYLNFTWFVHTAQPQVLNQLGINPATLAIFATRNTQLLEESGYCCYYGYHGALPISAPWGPGIFTTVWGSVTSYSIGAIGHEMAEWLNDPFYDNVVPRWINPNGGRCGQAGGDGLLEVGDPVTNHTFILGGFQMQDEAFYSWFSRDVPSLAINGQYDLLGALTRPATSCATPAPTPTPIATP